MNYTQVLEDLEIDFKVLIEDRPTKNTHLQLPDLLVAEVFPKQVAPEPNIPPDLIILEPEIFEQLQAEPLAQPQNLRRSQRERKSVISSDYIVYLHEVEENGGDDNDPLTFNQAWKVSKLISGLRLWKLS